MELIIFGIGFGLLMGLGMFALLILPAIREDRRSKQALAENNNTQSQTCECSETKTDG
jgi:hypothetical protein